MTTFIRLAGALVSALLALPAAGQTTPKADFDIPPQRLDVALEQAAQVQRVQILFSENDVKNLSTPGVKGRLSTYEAVQKLIEGTNLTAVANQNNAIAIRPKAAERGGQTENPTQLAQAQSAERRDATDSQASSSDRKAVQLEGIVVTARKREERLLDVPSSVAVVSAEEIELRRLVSGEDYLRGIPGVSQMGRRGQESINIRGMETSTTGQNFSTGATVATYFGETPTTTAAGINSGANIDVKLVDIERVEVLRGPQGTAFGSSALGGAVRVIPAAPKLDRLDGKAVGGYSVTSGSGGDNYLGHVVLNLPLVKDMLALRAVAYHFDNSGYYSNISGSDPTFQSTTATKYGAQAFTSDDDGQGATRFTGARIAVLLQPRNDLKFGLNLLTQKAEMDGQAVATRPGYDQAFFWVAPEHMGRGQKFGFTDVKIDIANATFDYDFGWANIHGTYSHTKGATQYGVPYGTAGLDWPGSLGTDDSHRERNAEIRLATQLSVPWQFLGGLYVEDLKDDTNLTQRYFGPRQFQPVGTEPLIGTYLESRHLKQKAAFGELSWDFLPSFTLTGGARAYDFERTSQLQTFGPFYGVASTNVRADASGTTYRANLNYKASQNTLIYGLFSQGFRLGKPQAPLPSSLCDINSDGILDGTTGTSIASTGQLGSDTVDNYELGAKFSLLDGSFIFTGDIFRMEWTGVPVRILAPGVPGSTDGRGCGRAYNANAGEARSEGIELQASLYATKALRIDVGGSSIRARLTEDAPALSSSKGTRLPGSPRNKVSLGVQYELEAWGHRTLLRADSTYVGTYFGNINQNPQTKAGGYLKVDVSWRVVTGRFDVDLFVHNLTNEDEFTFRDGSALGLDFGYRLQPRTIGMQLGYRF